MFKAYLNSKYNDNEFRQKVRSWEAQQKEFKGDPLFGIYGRHGQSYGNLFNSFLKKGTLHECPSVVMKTVQSTHGSRYPLTELGRQQAHAMNSWFDECFPFPLDYVYGSTHKRASETCFLSILTRLKKKQISQRRIKFLPWRTERNWGVHERFNPKLRDDYMALRKLMHNDPLHIAPERGENLMTLARRSVYPMKKITRERHSKQILYCPGHGENNWMERFVHEHMGEERFMEIERSKNPRDKIHNGSLLIYTCMDPDSGEVSEYYTHWCMIVPWEPQYDIPWTTIDRHAATRTTLTSLEASTEVPKKNIYVCRT